MFINDLHDLTRPINDYRVLCPVWPPGAHMLFPFSSKYMFARLLINRASTHFFQISLNISSPWVDVVCLSAVWALMLVKETWRSSSKAMDAFGRLTWKTGLALWWVLLTHFLRVFDVWGDWWNLYLTAPCCLIFTGVWRSQGRRWCSVWAEWKRAVQWEVRDWDAYTIYMIRLVLFG